MFDESVARTKECRIVPMMLIPGHIAGQMNAVAPACSGNGCMHWFVAQEGSKLANTPEFGCCSLDNPVYRGVRNEP